MLVLSCRPDRSSWWRHHGQWSPHCTSGHGAHLETTVSSFVVINIPPVLGSVSTPQLHGDQCQCGHPAPLIATTRQCNTAGLGAERDQSCHPPKSNCWPGRDTGEKHNTSQNTLYRQLSSPGSDTASARSLPYLNTLDEDNRNPPHSWSSSKPEQKTSTRHEFF